MTMERFPLPSRLYAAPTCLVILAVAQTALTALVGMVSEIDTTDMVGLGDHREVEQRAGQVRIPAWAGMRKQQV